MRLSQPQNYKENLIMNITNECNIYDKLSVKESMMLK